MRSDNYRMRSGSSCMRSVSSCMRNASSCMRNASSCMRSASYGRRSVSIGSLFSLKRGILPSNLLFDDKMGPIKKLFRSYLPSKPSPDSSGSPLLCFGNEDAAATADSGTQMGREPDIGSKSVFIKPQASVCPRWLSICLGCLPRGCKIGRTRVRLW